MTSATVAADIAHLGGVAHIQDLLSLGYTRRRVAALAHSGALLRPRIGWYASPLLTPDEVRAIRVGGRLGCISAARAHGLPVPPDGRLHVSLDAHATRLRTSTDARRHVHAGEEAGVVWHRDAEEHGAGADRVRVPVGLCLHEMLDCAPFEWAVAAADRALNLALVDASELEARLGASVPGRTVLAASSGLAESPLESIMRVRLMQAGIVPILQATVGHYRADFLIDGWLVIECDGAAVHSAPEQFEVDRRRDAYFASTGYRVLRFSYSQVMNEWPSTLHTILVVLRQGAPERRLP